MTDTMGRMHSDAQFAGSSSVPAHVEMMGLIGMGNNPMVGATVAVAVAMGTTGSVGYMFDHKGVLVVDHTEEVDEEAADAAGLGGRCRGH
jgi:hypothetical protein